MTWIDEQTNFLQEIDATWDVLKTRISVEINQAVSTQRKCLLFNWFTHLKHIYEELKSQQNWGPGSSLRKKIARFLAACSLVKPRVPSHSSIWATHNPVWPISSPMPFSTLYGFDVYVSGTDFWSVAATGHYSQEISESLLILRILPFIESFVDVGANIGFYSLLAAKLSPEQFSVIAFEPSRQNYSTFQQSILANHLEGKIQAYPLAIDSAPQHLKLYLCSSGSGGNSVAWPISEEYEVVESITLNEVQQRYLPRFPKTLIKIDVEYHEQAVINGASHWLSAQQPPIILFEAAQKTPHSTNNSVTLVRKLNSFGYTVYPILQPMNERSPLGTACSFWSCKSPTQNYLALPAHALDLLEILKKPIDIRLFTRREHLLALQMFLKNSLASLVTA